jgi:hypothetical protein
MREKRRCETMELRKTRRSSAPWPTGKWGRARAPWLVMDCSGDGD